MAILNQDGNPEYTEAETKENEYISTIQTAVDLLGAETRMLKMAEECIELADAVFKVLNGKKSANLFKEMADVQQTLDQLKLIFPNWSECIDQSLGELQVAINKQKAAMMKGKKKG